MQPLPPRPLMLAPMVELSHRPLRELIESFGGCDRYYTEMTSAAGYLANSPYDRFFVDSEPRPERTAVQFYGAEVEPIAAAAARLLGERTAAGSCLGGLDANFGCSAPLIEKAGGGVSWMKDADRSARLIAALKTAAPGVPVSAKLRLGYEASEAALIAFCRALEAAGADYIVVHPRLKHEKFRRSGHWEFVAAVSTAVGIPVIGNGDIRDAGGYRTVMERYGATGAMLGREAVRRPWIFSLIRGKEANPAFGMSVAIEETGLRMIALIRELLPSPLHISRARRFFFYYCDNLSFGHHLRWSIQNADGLDEVERLFRAYFDEVPSDRVRLER
ncbi:MAG TPA: tRNA-dihydrouridine synthase [Spirochaetales bacterium]|nr:tRNA-dihydrouridine synthase [Spirochaetales bacterium]HPM73726.1 tRNA-dihydrouridine synthase [Spirochaetales bacterium]